MNRIVKNTNYKRLTVKKIIGMALFSIGVLSAVPSHAVTLGSEAQFIIKTSDGKVNFDYPEATKESINANNPFAARKQIHMIDGTKVVVSNNYKNEELMDFSTWSFHREDENTIRINTNPSDLTRVVNGELKGLGVGGMSERFNSSEPIYLLGDKIKVYVQKDSDTDPQEIQYYEDELVTYYIPTNPFFPYQFSLNSAKYQVQVQVIGDLKLLNQEPNLIELGQGDFFKISKSNLEVIQDYQKSVGPLEISVTYEEMGEEYVETFPLGLTQQIRIYGKDNPVKYTVSTSEVTGMVIEPVDNYAEGFSKLSLFTSIDGGQSHFEFTKETITQIALKQSDNNFSYVLTSNLPQGISQISKALPTEVSVGFEQSGYIKILPHNPLIQGGLVAKPTKATATLDDLEGHLNQPFPEGVEAHVIPVDQADGDDLGINFDSGAATGGCTLNLNDSSFPPLHWVLLLGIGMIVTTLRQRQSQQKSVEVN